MAGATAFFTTFAMPPIIFILIQLFGLFIGRRNVGRQFIQTLTDTFGESGATQVRQVLRSIRSFNDNWYIIIGGFIFLLFVATTLFTVIKNSLDQVWQIAVKEKPGVKFLLNIRLRSLAVIFLTGLLFVADMLLESVEVIAGEYLETIQSGLGYYFRGVVDELLAIVIVAVWFTSLFRFLADGKPTWRAALIGGLLTGILFSIGKFLLKFFLVNSDIASLYGASGSIVLLLLFVFYSSFILYYGASFVYVYSKKNDLPISPVNMAFEYTIEEVE